VRQNFLRKKAKYAFDGIKDLLNKLGINMLGMKVYFICCKNLVWQWRICSMKETHGKSCVIKIFKNLLPLNDQLAENLKKCLIIKS